MWKMSSKYYPNRSIVRPNCNKGTVCFISRLIKGLSSQYFEDICVLLIGGVCGKCPLNTTRTVLSCGQIAIRGQCVFYYDLLRVFTVNVLRNFGFSCMGVKVANVFLILHESLYLVGQSGITVQCF